MKAPPRGRERRKARGKGSLIFKQTAAGLVTVHCFHFVKVPAADMRVSYRGQYTGFPSRERGFESRRPLQIQTKEETMDELLFGISLILLGIAGMMIVLSAASAEITRYDTPMVWKEEKDEID